MNAIQIQDLINKIGKFNVNLFLQDYLEKGEDLLELELEKVEQLNNELNQKLLVQLKEKSDIELLQRFIELTNVSGIALEELYHQFRVQQSESNNSNQVFDKSVPTACKIIDYKLDYLSNITKDLQSKIAYFDYKISTDFNDNSDKSLSSNQNQEYKITSQEHEINSRATFNLSKKESLMLLFILEEVNLLKFDNNTQRKIFIEQNFNFTEVRNNAFYGNSSPMTGIQSEYSKFNSNDRDELKSNNKTLENLSKKLITILEEFEFNKKTK